jgi:uncharacterized protein (TIGR03086 family)
MDLSSAYLERLEVVGNLVARVRPDRLADPTPCPDYDLRTLINHFITGVRLFARGAGGELARGELASLAAPGGERLDHIASVGDDPAAAVRAAVEGARRAWSGPAPDPEPSGDDDRVPSSMVLFVALGEAVIHGWDIATATGQRYDVPDDLAASLLEGMSGRMGGGERPPGMPFASEVPISGDAPALDRLIAFSGRDPSRSA